MANKAKCIKLLDIFVKSLIIEDHLKLPLPSVNVYFQGASKWVEIKALLTAFLTFLTISKCELSGSINRVKIKAHFPYTGPI